jgi:putative Ca2+/H+ antiporter (TMEM165/GDT1 family)
VTFCHAEGLAFFLIKRRRNMTAFWASLVFVVLAEMGDKTQLATVALAAKYQSSVAVWFGTNIGMLIADAIGIVMGKHIPERAVKWGAAVIFIGFGIYGIHENVSEQILTPVVEIASLFVLGIAGYFLARVSQDKTAPEPEG